MSRRPIAVITAAALLTAGLAVLSANRGASAAQEPPALSLASSIPGMSPSYGSAVSSDGRWVAFEADRSGEPWTIWMHDMDDAGSTRLLPGLDGLSATLPSMSGDAGLVALLGTDTAGTRPLGGDRQLYVVNRKDPDHPVLKQVTGTPNDLPYQRINCAFGTSDGGRSTECAPKLSRDGTTLVDYVEQSISSHDLELTVSGQSTQTDRGFYPVLDLGAYATSSESTVALKNTGDDAIVYPDTGPVLNGDPRFTISASTCAATLQPGASCSVTVKFVVGQDCADEANAVLQFPATSSAAGQTAVTLTAGGECGVLSALPRAAAAQECTGPSEYQYGLPEAFDPHDSGDGRPHPWFSLGSVPAGQLNIAALTVRNNSSAAAVPRLTSPGCGLKLVVPATAGADACRPGVAVQPSASCTAYVEYNLAQVTPFTASIHLGGAVYRIGGETERRVVAAWRDPGATGDVGPARIVSVTGAGDVPMDGFQPTVSADGRWVGFVSRTALGRPATDPRADPPQTQVYLHDTDSKGDRTYQPGTTTLVSLTAGGTLPVSADHPSVSDDGNRIAFASWDPAAGTGHQRQVHARDVRAQQTVLASSGPDGTGADALTYEPVLSGDGYTIAYLSSASNLGLGSLPGYRVIARDLTKDFAGGRGQNELVSPRPAGAGSDSADGYIALSQSGTDVTFASADQLDESNDTDNESDVYQARRNGSASIAPSPLDFGATPVGTASGAKALTITNTGSVAVRYEKPQFSSADFAATSDQCTNQWVRPGQSCSYLVTFTPKAAGARTGRGYVNGTAGSLRADLTGRGISNSQTAGETTQVSTNNGQHLDPSISDNGQYVAYRTNQNGSDGEPTTINVRNQATKEIRAFGQHDAVGAPVISGDGSRAVYNARDGQVVRTIVATASGKHPVSDTTTDLQYQRPCAYAAFSRECRPALSGDGRTVAIPAQLNPVSDALTLTVQGSSETTGHPVDSVIDLAGGGTWTLTVQTDRPISFTGKPTVTSDSGFSAGASTCNGALGSGAACTVQVSYNACSGRGIGRLQLPGATPDGQAAISLLANGSCVKIAPNRPKAACATMPAPTYSPSPQAQQTNTGNTLASADRVPIGRIQYIALQVNAQQTEQQLTFESDCDFALVSPPNPDPDRPAPCVPGQLVPANTACTAYVGFRPDAVAPSGASLIATGGFSPVSYRFAGVGYRDVVVTRTDTAGDATFAGAPEIASRDSSGALVDGGQPSLSRDGRYVAFVSGAPIDRPAGNSLQVYRRDRTAGTTMLVSQLADGNIGPDPAQLPSLSGAGDRVAFVSDGHRPSLKARSTAKAAFDYPSLVWVRDIPSNRTVLASAAAGKPAEAADDWSYDPSLSDDGSTVGFSSDATDLVTDPGNDHRAVYVRFLEPDFKNTADRFSERVSLTTAGTVPEDGASDSAALSADGAFTAFDSTSGLVPTDADDAGYDVYVRRRPAQLVIEPAATDFGSVPVGKSSSTRQLVVRNTGTGPAAAGPSSVGAPFVAGSNVCRTTLHRGESCPVDARFMPSAAGRFSGVLTVPSMQGYLAGPSVSAGLSGTGTTATPVARMSVVPTSLAFPSTTVGKAAPPASVQIRNTGDVALNITATMNSSGDFGTDLGQCTTVMPGTTCALPVTFAPRRAGALTGTLVLRATSTVTDPPAVTVQLTGTGRVVPGQAVASYRVAPRMLRFGPQILTTASAPQSVVVTNTGTTSLSVMAFSISNDFVPVSACGTLRPGKSCAIAVRFVPTALGTRMGFVRVLATAVGAAAPFPALVGAIGTTLTPALTVEPPVARPGQIVVAKGINFPPGRPAVLGWSVGLGAQPAVADRTGKFTVAMLVFRRDVLGQRVLGATVPGLPAPIQSRPVLVMPLSYQPPNFVLRW